MAGMRKFVAPLAALALSVAGCGPKKPQKAAWEGAGFIRQIDAGAEAFVSVKNPAGLWDDFAGATRPMLSDPAVRGEWRRSAWGSLASVAFAGTDTAAWQRALEEAGHEEMFVAFGPGTAEQLAAVQQIKRLFEAARLRDLFTPALPADAAHAPAPDPTSDSLEEAALTSVGIPMPPAMEAALEKFVAGASLPPVILGVKLSGDGGLLPQLLEAWAKNLPARATKDTVADGPLKGFTRVKAPVAGLVPRDAAVRARDLLGASIGDAYAATRIVRALLAKPVVVAFGQKEGYFLVCLGSSDNPPPLAASFGSSLASTPELSRIEGLLGPSGRGIFYANALVVALAASPPPVGEYLDAAVDSALEFAPADRVRPLREAAAKLRAQAEAAFRPRVAAAAGVLLQEENAWKVEMFGGSIAPRLAKDNGAPLACGGALAWRERWERGYTGQIAQLASGLAEFSSSWTETLGPIFLSQRALSQTKAVLALAARPVQQLGLVPTDAWDSALTQDRALVVALDGTMPPPPFLPASASKALMPRAAIVAGVRNASALDNLVASIAPEGAGSPAQETLPGGGTMSQLAIPLAGPDLSAAIARERDLWVLGTSGPFVRSVAEQTQGDGGNPCVQSIALETAPVASFLSAWADAVEADPSLASLPRGVLPEKLSTLRAAAEVLRAPRKFTCEMRWEGQEIRRTAVLAPAP